jgi:hypothetical protein
MALNGTPTVWNPVPPGTNLSGTKSSALDWWTSRVLSQVYTVALDQVVADEDVIELLGEPIEVDYAAEELFIRKRTGNLNLSEEAIAFEIKGSKQSATVTVLAATPEQQLRIREIRVTAADGQTIFVDPPMDEQITIR